jgi:hypothetical protein
MLSGNDSQAHRVKMAAMWVFLAPLIIILGTADALTGGRTRNWLRGQ